MKVWCCAKTAEAKVRPNKAIEIPAPIFMVPFRMPGVRNDETMARVLLKAGEGCSIDENCFHVAVRHIGRVRRAADVWSVAVALPGSHDP